MGLRERVIEGGAERKNRGEGAVREGQRRRGRRGSLRSISEKICS